MTDRSASCAGQTPPAVAIVLLAGGAGSRFGGVGHKLLADLPESSDERAMTVFERSVTHAISAGLGPPIVITGALHDTLIDTLSDDVRAELTFVHNDRWAEGQITSVRAGLAAAEAQGASGAVIGLADQPAITPSAWRRVARAPGPIAVATYDGRRGNPVRLDAAVWDLLPDHGDEGARTLIRVRPDLVCEVACNGSPADIDTEEDLRRWQNN